MPGICDSLSHSNCLFLDTIAKYGGSDTHYSCVCEQHGDWVSPIKVLIDKIKSPAACTEEPNILSSATHGAMR